MRLRGSKGGREGADNNVIIQSGHNVNGSGDNAAAAIDDDDVDDDDVDVGDDE